MLKMIFSRRFRTAWISVVNVYNEYVHSFSHPVWCAFKIFVGYSEKFPFIYLCHDFSTILPCMDIQGNEQNQAIKWYSNRTFSDIN